MDFILSKHTRVGLDFHKPLEDIENEEEAIAKAHETALQTKEGVVVALFTREGDPVVAWTVLEARI